MTTRRTLPAWCLIAALCAACPTQPTPGPADMTAPQDMATTNDMPDQAPDVGTDAGADADADQDMPPASECTFTPGPPEEYPDPQIHTPRWAFEPWISKDLSDTADTYSFVEGFRTRDIPVGVVVLDSPWETHYNTFIPNPDRYPEFEKLVGDLRDQDIRIVLWVTQMVNVDGFDLEPGGDTYEGPSPNYVPGQKCGYYVNGSRRYRWWKGRGSGVDFFNEEARQWWHRQQDALLELGINGWKLDFGEDYIRSEMIETAQGTVTHQEYSEAYYQDFYAYGAAKREGGTSEFVTMVRAYDKSYEFPGRFYARPEHAPVVWAGDNRRDWIGLVDALDHIFRSAQAGYVVVGSDLGGYLDRDDQRLSERVPFDQDNFARWTGVAAMTPFMQLHGRANLEPWAVPERVDDTIRVYRYWAKLHSALVPFWYSLAEEAYAGGPNLLRPIGADETAWAEDWRYQLGDAFLVASPFDGTGVRDVILPDGTQWYDWWDASRVYDGGTTLTDYDITADQVQIPLFVREGAIIPMKVVDDVNGLGTEARKDAHTVLIYPGTMASSFKVHDEDDQLTEITATRDTVTTTLTWTRTSAPTYVRVRGDNAQVSVNGQMLTSVDDAATLDAADSGWYSDGPFTWIKLEASTDPITVTLLDAAVQ